MNNIESRRSILFLDNDRVSREVVKSYLTDSYNIEVEENIEEALIKISKRKYDLILLDINLGVGMTGLDVLRFPPGKGLPLQAARASSAAAAAIRFI